MMKYMTQGVFVAGIIMVAVGISIFGGVQTGYAQQAGDEEEQGEQAEEQASAEVDEEELARRAEVMATTPPRVLSSDLPARIIVTARQLEVSFVIVDSDPVVEVTINDETEPITVSNTVVIRKKLTFNAGEQLIKVTATDEQGNTRTRQFLVIYDPENNYRAKAEARAAEAASGVQWSVNLDLAFHVDTNPTNDLSLPFSVTDEVDLVGTVPDDQQEDTRSTLGVMTGLRFGNQLSGVFGLQASNYSNPDNHQLASLVLQMGATYLFAKNPAKSNHVRLGFTLMDINVSGSDYAQIALLQPAYQIPLGTRRGRARSHRFGLDLQGKSLADPERDSVFAYGLNWNYLRTNEDQSGSFTSTLSTGFSSEGEEDTEYNHFTENLAWHSLWQNGMIYDIRFRFQVRAYSTAEALIKRLYNTADRVDTILGLDQAVGYQLHKDWSVLFDYNYKLAVSNYSPYVRTIYGLRVKGAF